jgi:hypothetical protein
MQDIRHHSGSLRMKSQSDDRLDEDIAQRNRGPRLRHGKCHGICREEEPAARIDERMNLITSEVSQNIRLGETIRNSMEGWRV